MLRTSRNLVHKRIVTSKAVVPIPRPRVRPSASLSEKGIAVVGDIVGEEVLVDEVERMKTEVASDVVNCRRYCKGRHP